MKGTTRSSHPPTASLHDKDVPPVVAQVWADVAAVSRNLVENLKRERAIIHEYFLQQERQIAHNQSRFVDLECADRYADDPSFFLWNPDRSLNRQDFDYLHHHRKRFVPPVRELLEIVNAKITAQTAEGEPRYFNKLETNIGWTPHIVPIIFALHNRFSLEPSRLADKLVRCGIWSNARNSRRCHQWWLCPLCLWNDHLKVAVHAFGEQSGAFYRAQRWWFITCGFTANPNNAKAVLKVLEPDDFHFVRGDHSYEAFPVSLGGKPGICHEDARILARITQEAFEDIYQADLVDGYRERLEGAFQLNPGGSNRANIHRHGVANGRETNGQYIAESLFQSMLQGLAKYRSLLSRGYFPDVLVGQVTNPGHLEKCLCYMDKVVPIALIVADAMQRSEGKLPDGRWDRKYVSELENSLQQLIRDDIPNIVEDFHSERVVWKVRRRKSVGNMTFTDKPDKKGKCIGDEPDWHKRKRHKAAEKLKKARDRAKERQAKDEANGIRVTRKPVSRARRNPRRLSRSLGLPIQKPRDGSAAQPIGRTMPQKRRLKVKVKNASVLNSTPDQLDVPECAVEVIQAKGSSANEKARLRPLVWPTARRRLPGLDSS